MNNLLLVIGNIGQPIAFTDVHQIQDTFLKARPVESNTGIQKPGSDPRIFPDGIRDFSHVGPCGLAEGRHGIHRRNPLRQESIRSQLRELGGPKIHGDDSVLRYPVSINRLQHCDDPLFLGGLPPAYQNLKTLSGFSRSSMAVPLARNSGLDNI